MSFNDCSQVAVRGKNTFNNVHGSQYNASVIHVNHQTQVERTEYDEFEDVKRGRIVTLKRLHTEDLSERWKDEVFVRKPARSTRRTICTVEVRPDQAKYTTIVYEGKDARISWEEDFKRYSRSGLTTPDAWQLYGLNRSDVPLLIFHDELVPLGHFYTHTFWGDFYIEWLKTQMNCSASEIWLSARGVLCWGPAGPSLDFLYAQTVTTIRVPSQAEMLQDDSCIHFLQQFRSSKLDYCIIKHARGRERRAYLDKYLKSTDCHSSSNQDPLDWKEEYPHLKRLFRNVPHQLPLEIISGLRFDTVYSPFRGAVARWSSDSVALWELDQMGGLMDETLLEDGLMRFQLTSSEGLFLKYIFDDSDQIFTSWLAQFSSVISDVSENMNDYYVSKPPHIIFTSVESDNPPEYSPPREAPPIYLFVDLHPSLTISGLSLWLKGHKPFHFWSFDEDGRSEMSKEERVRWQVPELAFSAVGNFDLLSWPNSTYTALFTWQLARGYDPFTTDFAQSLGFQELEAIGAKKDEERFEVIDTSETEAEADSEWELVS